MFKVNFVAVVVVAIIVMTVVVVRLLVVMMIVLMLSERVIQAARPFFNTIKVRNNKWYKLSVVGKLQHVGKSENSFPRPFHCLAGGRL